jgi:hypothetical protein
MECFVSTCEKPVYVKGLCKAHYQRAWRTGSPESDGTVTYTRVRNGKTQTVTRRVRSGEVGYTRTPLYRAWSSMHRRCYNETASNYRWYGGRGITVCKAWHDFFTFRDWAEAHGYAQGMELDRVNKDRLYSPRNCRYLPKRVNIDRKGRNAPLVALQPSVYRALDLAAGSGSPDTLANQIIKDWLAAQGAAPGRSRKEVMPRCP